MTFSEQANESQSSRILILGIWHHLSHKRHIQLGLLFLLMLASGFAELVSLGVVLPFLAVLTEPEKLWQQPLVQKLAVQFDFIEPSQLVLPISLTFALAAALSAIIRLINLRLAGWLAASVGSDLSCEIYRRTLHQPYELLIQNNSSELISGSTMKIARSMGAFWATLQLLISSIVAIGLFAGMFLIDWFISLLSAGLFGGLYALIAFQSRKELRHNSQLIAVASQLQIKTLQEGLGAIREMILSGNQSTYLDIYQSTDRPQRHLVVKNQFLSLYPRYMVEAFGLVGLAVTGGMLALQEGSAKGVIPLLGALALGAQRLLPALQQVYSNWSTVRGCNADLDFVLTQLNLPVTRTVMRSEPLQLLEAIRFEDIHFRYNEDRSEVLKGLDFEIRRGEKIGLIGTTGSGKSTTVDLLMGLLKPTSGRLLVDGIDVHNLETPGKLEAWRAAIAHVPQSIFLTDASIAENIAFGVPVKEIDFALVKKVAQQAQIAYFIESNPHGYHTFVGERGVRLSGGQRQRIGIARALYKQASVLVLDEATSALDTDTENSVMEAIECLSSNLTIIMIAHRFSTLEHCDRVIHLETGSVISISGTNPTS